MELKDYARCHGINISEDDIYIDIISGFKDGEIRPKYSDLKRRIEDGEYQQILFSYLYFSELQNNRWRNKSFRHS